LGQSLGHARPPPGHIVTGGSIPGFPRPTHAFAGVAEWYDAESALASTMDSNAVQSERCSCLVRRSGSTRLCRLRSYSGVLRLVSRIAGTFDPSRYAMKNVRPPQSSTLHRPVRSISENDRPRIAHSISTSTIKVTRHFMQKARTDTPSSRIAPTVAAQRGQMRSAFDVPILRTLREHRRVGNGRSIAEIAPYRGAIAFAVCVCSQLCTRLKRAPRRASCGLSGAKRSRGQNGERLAASPFMKCRLNSHRKL
jgi:hypothetical protein